MTLPFIILLGLSGLATAAPVDSLTLGQPASEKSHSFKDDGSQIIHGGLGETARQILPKKATDWEGGSISFRLKVDPKKPNYFTIRLWGSDRSEERLMLYAAGKQIGYRHLGDIESLDSPNGSPADQGRYFYQTMPLPVALTQGKTELDFEIRGNGPVWGYGNTFAQYQKPMLHPSRGIYRVYTHTDGFFTPPAEEKQGRAPAQITIRKQPGEEVIGQVKARVNGEIQAELKDARPLTQFQLWFLARAYPIDWTLAYQNASVVKKAVETLDLLFVAYQKDPEIIHSEPSIYNTEWFGIGPAAQAVVLLAEPLQPSLDQEIVGAPGISRRTGWAEMFVACRDWHREKRRLYTNQSMINDTYGIYFPNRGIAVLDPKKALPEAQALRYLHESAGLEPWLGSEKDGVPLRPMGENYFQLTAKGLTKELGFVGYYGEVLDWMTNLYEATRPALDQPGDARLKAQLVKVAQARAAFRYPALDDEGHRAMRAAAVVGWRDQGHYPGDVTYGQRPTWDCSALESAAATLDPTLIGYAQQMLADNQFFASIERGLQDKGLRVTAGLLAVPENYEKIKAQAAVATRLPMSAGQPDFVFSDEEDGVLALKNGHDILYASLYWRSRYAINFLARTHLIQPDFDRLAVVREETEFDDSGTVYTRPDWINMGFAGGGVPYPVDMHSAEAGEKLPIAKIPAGVAFKPGSENSYAGKGTFYTLRYGAYLIGMNMTTDRTFVLKTPSGIPTAVNLVSGKSEDLSAPVKVGPRSTVVLYFKK